MRAEPVKFPMTPEIPDTEEQPRVAAALVVTHIPASEHGMHGTVVTSTRLEVVRIVDFYRDDEFRR